MNSLDIQCVSQSQNLPTDQEFQTWIDLILPQSENFEIVIRIVDEDEMAEYNHQFRNKSGTTNILSFPFECPEPLTSNLLGDLLICAPVLEQEAKEQDKPLLHHWAHIVIHGTLHLLGYDHLNDEEAEEMEALEIKFLNVLNIKNPYEEIKLT